MPWQLSGNGRSGWSTKLIRGLKAEAAAGFQSRRERCREPTPVTPQYAAFTTYKAAVRLGMQTHIVEAHMVDEFGTAFATLVQQKVEAILLANDAFFLRERGRLIALAARYGMAAVYNWREFAADGGLMSYSPSLTQGYRQVGI